MLYSGDAGAPGAAIITGIADGSADTRQRITKITSQFQAGLRAAVRHRRVNIDMQNIQRLIDAPFQFLHGQPGAKPDDQITFRPKPVPLRHRDKFR